MRKAWRLLRARFHGLFTYGCASHAFHLHAGDLCKTLQLQRLVDGMGVINTWFSRHLGAGGRATLFRLQKAASGKTSAPPNPGRTRKWNGQVVSAEWHLANHQVLVSLVTDAGFDASSDPAKLLKRTILDLDGVFWPLLPQFITLMQPLRLAVHTLQGNHAKIGDVMGAWVRIHNAQMELLSSSTCTFSSATVAHVKATFSARFRFLYHPIHLVAFALDPRYVSICKAPPSVIRYWIRELYGAEGDAHTLTQLVSEYGLFRASAQDPAQADIWSPLATADSIRWWRSWGDEFPLLKDFALKLLSLPPTSASAERNWSTQDFIVSKRRNRLAAARAEKLVYIYFNLRSIKHADAQRLGPGVTEEAHHWHVGIRH
uniref:HAT C-terminal dimerisation domain-containing protein n=1 Tax=Haptolina brevifila TaxID=156173 RepID=A0A7S2NQZ8_9EUKA